MYFDTAPPQAKLPGDFPTINSVVTVENCWYYLSLLERFVDITKDMTEDVLKLYLVRAEYRYFQWRSTNSTSKLRRVLSLSLPPLDVAFFWQAHMLSPLRYYEDSIRVPFYNIEHTIPLQRIQEEYKSPTRAVEDEWKKVMGNEPYNLTKESLLEKGTCASVTCIVCSAHMESPWEEYAEWRTDYTIALQCHSCFAMFTVKHVGKANLFADNEKKKMTAGLLLSHYYGHFTHNLEEHNLLQPLEKAKALPFNRGLRPLEEYMKAKQQDIHKEGYYEHGAGRIRKRVMDAIQSTYLCTPYRGSSIDLIQAVARQYKFAHKATKIINWNAPQGIIKGIRHYSSFLVLIRNNPGLTAVPTFEIDLAWHTHMLHHSNYRSFTQIYIGKLVNHDDNIPEVALDQHVQKTDLAWKDRIKKRKEAIAEREMAIVERQKAKELFEAREKKKQASMKYKIKTVFAFKNKKIGAINPYAGEYKPSPPSNGFSEEEDLFRGKYYPGSFQASAPYVPKLKSDDAEEEEIKENKEKNDINCNKEATKEKKEEDDNKYNIEEISYHDKRDIKDFISFKNSESLIDQTFVDVQKSVYGFIGTSNCANTDYLDQWDISTDAKSQAKIVENKDDTPKYTKVFLTVGDKSTKDLARNAMTLPKASQKQYASFRESENIRYNSSGDDFNWYLVSTAWSDAAATSCNHNSSCGVWSSGGCTSTSACATVAGASGGGNGSSSCGGGSSSCGGGGNSNCGSSCSSCGSSCGGGD